MSKFKKMPGQEELERLRNIVIDIGALADKLYDYTWGSVIENYFESEDPQDDVDFIESYARLVIQAAERLKKLI